jgi:hypothetical protein
MKMKTILTASAVLAMGVATPAFAQIASGTSAGPTTGGVGAGNTATSTSTSTDLQVQDVLNDKSINTDNSDNSVAISDVGNDKSMTALASFNTIDSYNGAGDDNNNQDNSAVVAEQDLSATVTNAPVLVLAALTGAINGNSGDNSVGGNAFAAYSGILNQGWNTGQGSNAQAATNVAARGTVSFSQ